jgi:aryl carrier-like protein
MKQDKTSAKELWKEQLTGASAPVFPPLPDPNYIPKVQRSNRILHHLDSHADAELEHKVVSIKRGSTTAATMIQAAWFLLLASYSNSTDIITGVTLNGRTAQLPGIDRIPGPTVTTIPFRARFTPDRRVQDFLQIIQKQYLKILPFAQFGLDNIRRASEDAVAACKFRSLLVVQSAHRAPDSKKILQGRSYSFPVMDFAIVMECELHKDNNIDFRATFDNQVLSEAQVRKMFQQMEQLLLRISVCGPSTTVAELQKELQTDVMMTHQADGTAHSSAPPKKCYKPPLTDMEKRISGIWKTLLGVDQVGLDDNFFELGGGSVLAMRLVSMARREGMTMTVAGIFKTPNLRQLALTVRENARVDEITPFSLLSGPSKAKLCNQATQQCRVSLEEIEDMYPISAMQLHYVTGYPEAEKDINGPWDWQSQAVYSLPHAIDFEKFKGIWISAIHRHQSLRTRVVNTGHGIFQVVLKEPEPFRWAEADDLDRCAEEDKTAPMTFGDRLLRLALVAPKDSDERFFVMTAHHMIYDAFARSMLFKELEAAYFQDLPDTPLPTMNQFVKYITEADKQSATDFWTSHLADANTKPLFLIPPGRIVFSIAEKSMTIDIPEIQRADCTLPTMVEISCSLTIARHLDCEDVILYSDRSGRNLPVEGIQDLIGPTTLFIPVRTHINPNQKVKDLLRESQQFNSTSIPFEHLGWLELREMSHLKDRLKDSLNININPHPLASLGKGWGLEYVSSHAGCDDPFGVNVDLYDGRMEWVVYYDERFVGGDVVERLLREMKRVFLTLVDAGLRPEMTVGGVLTSLAMM